MQAAQRLDVSTEVAKRVHPRLRECSRQVGAEVWYATAVTTFTKPGNHFFGDPCRISLETESESEIESESESFSSSTDSPDSPYSPPPSLSKKWEIKQRQININKFFHELDSDE